MDKAVTPVATFAGPQVHGEPTTAHLVKIEDLEASPLFKGYFDVVNAAFRLKLPPYIADAHDRFLKPEQALEELGAGSFTIIVAQGDADSHPGKVLGVGAARPAPDHSASEVVYGTDAQKDTMKEVQWTLKVRTPIPGAVDWELKHVCVDPGAMRQGLAGFILGMLDEQIVARVQEMHNDDGTTPKVRVLITTIKQLNGIWYEKRGYTLVQGDDYPAGTLKGSAPFSVWHMSKIIE